MDVLFVMGDSAARVIGPMTRPLVTEPRGPTGLAGARFRPGAALELLGIAARDLRDDTALVGDAWGARGRSLDGRLAHARSPRAAILAIEAELASRVASARSPDPRLAPRDRDAAGCRGRAPDPCRQRRRRPERAPARAPLRGARGLRPEALRARRPPGEIDADDPAQRQCRLLVAQPRHRQRVLGSGAPGAGVSGAHRRDSRGETVVVDPQGTVVILAQPAPEK